MSWTNTGGGDHGGADWTPANAATIAGVHYNIGTFLVTSGWTVNIDTATELEVYANTISVVGTINGNLKGYQGTIGAGGGTGGGGAGYYNSGYGGGGGGGYGGDGGDGSDGGIGLGGSAHGAASDAAIVLGSAGGGGGSASNTGGHGGGSVSLYGNSVSVTGTITCSGGISAVHDRGSGGGGSGGGILLVGNTIVATGSFNYNGGDSISAGAAGEGGSGGGGRRIFLYCTSLNVSGITEDGSAGTPAGTGNAGSAGVGASAKISQCTSSVPLGQTFTIGSDSASVIDKVVLWVTAVTTSGDFILKLWDSTSKNTEYGTKTVTISATGSTDFVFSDWIRIPDGSATYYIELTTAGAGDINIGVYGISTYAGGEFYRNAVEVSRFDLYHQVYSVDHVKSATIYNTTDTTVKSNVTNLMLVGAVHRIGSDGVGTVQYSDAFTTLKYLADYHAISSVTYDAANDKLDIADAGYIDYEMDVKYPITGIPTLTSQINITSGTPTIQISTNGSTWYDIDTAIVDDVDTAYELDNATSLSLKGRTSFYYRIDCGGTGTVTCSVKSFELDIVIVTIDAENPAINTGAANTFRCDQDTDSGLNCEVSLIYRDRKWAS